MTPTIYALEWKLTIEKVVVAAVAAASVASLARRAVPRSLLYVDAILAF